MCICKHEYYTYKYTSNYCWLRLIQGLIRDERMVHGMDPFNGRMRMEEKWDGQMTLVFCQSSRYAKSEWETLLNFDIPHTYTRDNESLTFYRTDNYQPSNLIKRPQISIQLNVVQPFGPLNRPAVYHHGTVGRFIPLNDIWWTVGTVKETWRLVVVGTVKCRKFIVSGTHARTSIIRVMWSQFLLLIYFEDDDSGNT